MASEDQITIVQPAISDVEKEEAFVTDHINETQRVCDEFDAKVASANAGDGSPPPRGEKSYIKLNREMNKDMSARKDMLVNFKPSMPFGTLYYAPGISRDPVKGCIRDWALIKLDGDRFPELPHNVVRTQTAK